MRILNEEGPHNEDSQASNLTTVTLSSPNQTVSTESKYLNGVFLSPEEHASLLAKGSFCSNFSGDLTKICFPIANVQQPEMDPTVFENLWG